MSKTRLSLKDIELTNEGILIRNIELIDSVSGEVLRPAKLTKELIELFKVIEVDIDAFFEMQKIKENKQLSILINTFKLYS